MLVSVPSVSAEEMSAAQRRCLGQGSGPGCAVEVGGGGCWLLGAEAGDQGCALIF